MKRSSLIGINVLDVAADTNLLISADFNTIGMKDITGQPFHSPLSHISLQGRCFLWYNSIKSHKVGPKGKTVDYLLLERKGKGTFDNTETVTLEAEKHRTHSSPFITDNYKRENATINKQRKFTSIHESKKL